MQINRTWSFDIQLSVKVLLYIFYITFIEWVSMIKIARKTILHQDSKKYSHRESSMITHVSLYHLLWLYKVRITGYCSHIRKMLRIKSDIAAIMKIYQYIQYRDRQKFTCTSYVISGRVVCDLLLRLMFIWIQKFSDTYNQGSLDLNYWCDIVQLNSCSRSPVVLAACLL